MPGSAETAVSVVARPAVLDSPAGTNPSAVAPPLHFQSIIYRLERPGKLEQQYLM